MDLEAVDQHLSIAGLDEVEAVALITLGDQLIARRRSNRPGVRGQLLERGHVQSPEQGYAVQQPDDPATAGCQLIGVDDPHPRRDHQDRQR